MKEIPLTLGKVALVDDEDYPILSQHKWCANKDFRQNTFYVVRTIRSNGKIGKERMHRVIMNPPANMQIDHINGDGLDNRRENLRIVTSRQNHQNLHCKKSSKYPGVCWHKRIKKWGVNISINKKIRHLGYFDNELDAATVYKVACAVLVED